MEEIKVSPDYNWFRSTVPLRRIIVDDDDSKVWSLYDAGPKSIRCPIIFLPPVSGTAEVFFQQLLALTGWGYRVISEDQSEDDAEEEVIEKPEAVPSSKQPVFRFLSKCRTTRPKQKTSTTSIRQQIIKYKEELSHPITEDTGTDFLLEKSDSFYQSLKPFELDLLAMPASQAFAERVFSVTGDLTRGRCNRGRVTLE